MIANLIGSSKWFPVGEVVNQKHPSCGDLTLLQRSVVQGVELVRGLVSEEKAGERKGESPG